MIRPALLATVLVSSGALAEGVEVEIEFRHQPDASGERTENRSITLEDGEITLEEHTAASDRYDDRIATAEEEAAVTALVEARIAAVELTPGARVTAPLVEVQFEIEAGSRRIEVEEIYPAGQVPAAYVELQRRFFDAAFE